MTGPTAAADADVLVVGAGVAGCAVARALAPDHDVTVLDRAGVAAGATARAAGEITVAPSFSDDPPLADYANAFFREFSGTGEFTFTGAPSVELVEAGRGDVARRRVDRLRSNGLDVAFLAPDDLVGRFPWFDPAPVDGGVVFENTGFVDPYTYAVTLQAEAADDGAAFRTGTPVTGLVVEDGAARGVETASGTLRAPHVVAAAGWRTGDLLRDVLEIPLRPYRTQCVVLEPERDTDESFPMGAIPDEHVYFRRERNGDLLVGGWSAAEDDPENAVRNADRAFGEHVAALLPRFFDGLGRTTLVDGWAGIDGATPDTRPVVDAPDAAPDGLVVATGFHGRGIMLSPVAAALVREFVTGEECGLTREHFALDRFESTSPDFEFESISGGAGD
ncbi:MAG: NAD(P)/FAD-dependent oxidoreductase [Haloferacaceae archaeon]